MGLRGPPKKPVVLEIAEGCPGRRPISTREPQPPRRRPKMPKAVKDDPRAALEWRRLIALLERMRVLTEADGKAIELLCRQESVRQQASESIAKVGLLTKHPETGHIHANPLLRIENEATDRVIRMLREFGQTPASRRGLEADISSELDEIESMIG